MCGFWTGAEKRVSSVGFKLFLRSHRDFGCEFGSADGQMSGSVPGRSAIILLAMTFFGFVLPKAISRGAVSGNPCDCRQSLRATGSGAILTAAHQAGSLLE